MNNKTKRRLEKLLENTGDMALKRRARNVIRGLELKRKDKVLDIGCGDGYYLHLLTNLNLGLRLSGTDYDKEGLKKARENITSSIEIKYGDLMDKLPFKTGSFDKAVISEVIEHLPDDKKGLKEVYRILKPKGTLCLTVPNANYPFLWDPASWLIERLFNTHIKSGFFAGIWNQHERLYRKEEITKVVELVGFKVRECQSLTYWCLPFNHYLVNSVARLLAHGNLKKKTKVSLSKYTKNPKRPSYLNIAFWLVNQLDKLNDFYQPKKSGVSIFVKASKV